MTTVVDRSKSGYRAAEGKNEKLKVDPTRNQPLKARVLRLGTIRARIVEFELGSTLHSIGHQD